VPFADVVTTSTHKTFRGPRGGGLILCKKKFADQIDKAVFPGTQGAPLINIIAARAVLFKEAMSARFKDYQKQTLLNAKILAEELSKGKIRLVSGGTDTHLILIDLRGLDIKGNEAEEALYSVGILVNKNLIPFDPEKSDVTSGIRIGASALTTRGLKEKEMREIAKFIFAVFDNRKDKTNRMEIKKGVEALATRFPLFHREWID
jgi:glycine hydroxymethyltransferase